MAAGYNLALIQLRPQPGGLSANQPRTVELIGEAARRGAQLVILPELCTTGYAFRDRASAAWAAEVVPGGPTLAAWEAAARRLGVYVVGGLVEVAADALYNTVALVGPQGYIGRYRKAHLLAGEKPLFQAGDEGFPTFHTEHGCLGLLTCFDLRFPEAPRALALAGAEVLCVPTTWTNLHKLKPWDDRGYCMANYLAQAHAYANRCYVACADRVGREADMTYLGCSLVVDPSGVVIAGPASPEREDILVAPVDPGRARDKRLGDANDLFADRRPELYGTLGVRG